MTEKMTISIALCTYNGERFLQEQLDSLAAQTRLPDEVVVGDDGSTDRTLEILSEWAGKVPFPVRIQQNQTVLKPPANFDATMSRCSGKVIFLCDQDDVWAANKIEKMLEVFEARPEVGLVCCYADSIGPDGEALPIDRTKISLAHILDLGIPLRSPFCLRHPNHIGCCLAVRRNVYQKCAPFPNTWGHDLWLFLNVPVFSEIESVRENLHHYRFHGGNESFPGNWAEKYEKYRKRASTYYSWILGTYYFTEKDLRFWLNWLEELPKTPFQKRNVLWMRANLKHFPNRGRVQRNFFLFFPLFLLEVFSGRYFARFQPVRSMAFDVWTGIKNGLNPLATLRLVGSLFGKIWRKLKCR